MGLDKTLESIQTQHSVTVEVLLVVKDLETRELVSTNYPLITVLVEEQPSLYGALNTGLNFATGTRINFLSVGSIFADSSGLRSILDAFALHPDTSTLICGVEQQRLNLPSTVLSQKSNSSFLHFWGNTIINYEGITVSRVSSLKTLQFDTRYKIAADYDFVGRLLRETTCLIFDIKLTIVEPPGISSEYSSLGYCEVNLIRKRRALDLLGRRFLFLFFLGAGLLHGVRYIRNSLHLRNYRRGLRKS